VILFGLKLFSITQSRTPSQPKDTSRVCAGSCSLIVTVQTPFLLGSDDLIKPADLPRFWPSLIIFYARKSRVPISTYIGMATGHFKARNFAD
jgi:hypothetical protein